ncbi:MAG: hypothetical protein QOH70_1022 [Blastocatellia bacterium]|jgi:hypothetical protein|nr:hypothetical protein [Blastocatellia bacterium]
MERFKSLSEVCQPDLRYRGRVDLDKTTGTVSETTIESIYDLIQPIALGAKVPDEVRSHFETAKNLALYSWFVYSFNIVAAMHAFASLEMALRAKSSDKKKQSFKGMLDKAFNNRKLTGGFGPPIDLSVALSRMRNDFAHGSRTMHGQGVAVLQMCAELINELFT